MTKKVISMRLSEAQNRQLEELSQAGFGNQTDILRIALDRLYISEIGEKNMKTLETLLTVDLKDVKLRYVGTIFGDADAGDKPWEGTGEEIWENLSQMFGDELNEEPFLDIHPTHSGERSGWYFQSGNLWNKGSWGEECVFEILEFSKPQQ